MKKRSAAVLLSLMLFGCGQEKTEGLNIYFFDAGKADAVLLYTDSSAVLIDTGLSGFGEEILRYMKDKDIDSLDALIITHFDKDHVGGAGEIIRNIRTDQVLVSDEPKDSDEYEDFTAACTEAGIDPYIVFGSEQYCFVLDEVSYCIDGPDKDNYSDKDSNNSSLITSVVYKDIRMLFAGDAQDERITEYLSAYDNSCDLLKVPYHGRWQETLPDLMETLKPSYAVICCSDTEGADQETVSLLTSYHTETYLTKDGGIFINTNGDTIRVTQ